MARYYFDLVESDGIVLDDEGMELSTLEAVREEAARSLADMARDSIRHRLPERAGMSVEVRDDAGPVMQVRLIFEIARLRQ